jgi:hypothetical protein
MASQALSELSALSSYSPQAAQPTAPAPLPRRSSQAAPAGQATPQLADEPLGARRGTRNAADVRSMLSGFRAGVEQGRIAFPGEAPEPEQEPAGER